MAYSNTIPSFCPIARQYGIILEVLDNGFAGQKNAGVLLLIPGHLPPEIPELAMMEKEMGKAKIDLGD